MSSSKKVKEKPHLGWYHGKMDSEKYHWKCNCCGMANKGGGVTRLKQDSWVGQMGNETSCRACKK